MNETRAHSAHPRQALDPPLILIASDNTDTRELYSLVLANHGFSVIEAGGCEQALDLAIRAAPDAIVLDLTPKLTSFEILKRLRASAPTFHTPILILTAGAVAAGEGADYAAADAQCIKPCMPSDFVNRLKALLFADTA
jgi:DNA-binding response OmpR family regulator